MPCMNRLNRGEIRRLVLAGFTLSYSGGDGKQVVTGGTDAGMAKLLVGGKAKLTALKKAGVRA